MKQLRLVLLFVIVVTLFPAVVWAQGDPPADIIDLVGALAIVRAAYGEGVIILSATLDADNACRQFEFADGTAVCVDETTGEILLVGDTDDGAVGNTDDGAVGDTDDGAVGNTDDAAVGDTDDDAVGNTDDGAVEDRSDDLGIRPQLPLKRPLLLHSPCSPTVL